MPKISALLPTYNTNPEQLRATIDSILGQTLGDFELLILDDCSPRPDVKEVLASYSDSRIRFMQNEKNLGISGARNKLLRLAQGEYLAVCDHDDISLPERFALQAAFLDEHQDVGVVGTMLERFPKHKILRMPEHNEDIEDLLMLTSMVEHPTAMIRKSVLQKNSIEYEEEFSPAEDYLMWVRLIGKTKFYNIQRVLLRYRSHASNVTHTEQEKMSRAIGMVAEIAHSEYPQIWSRAKRRLIWDSTYKLFGFIPIMKVEQKGQRKKYLLFCKLPIMRGKIRFNREKSF